MTRTPRRHVVMFSGGITSWAAAKRVAEQHGTEHLTLLFADTKAEDPDVYRFLHDAAANAGGQLVIVADGRTPWQVFSDTRFLGNSRVAKCSQYLKIIPCRDWITANTSPDDTTIHVGIDWTELHRLPAIVNGYKPWQATAPLTEPPYRWKPDLLADARAQGLEPPAMYAKGYPHANCAGNCVRGGQAAWAHQLRTRPDLYAQAETHEASLRGELGDVSILKDRTGGTAVPLTLTTFRERLERQKAGQPELFDTGEWGTCGCGPLGLSEETGA